MLVFIDESGDPGLRIEAGASRSFTVGLVVFENEADAHACDQRITALRRELGWSEKAEFHFRRNSDRIRETFLRAVAPQPFFYYGVVIQKDAAGIWREAFKEKEAFYHYVCGLVLESAKETLRDAIVVIDRSGGWDFRRRLSAQLKRKSNISGSLIKKVKMQDSKSNNLLQLVDYVASVINRAATGEKNGALLRRIIAHREISVQKWPKKNPPDLSL
ncbi:MAG: hypothetical protein RL141_125 [Candidatus Parcubacteria bacterium]|jgi:hypothetical protein